MGYGNLKWFSSNKWEGKYMEKSNIKVKSFAKELWLGLLVVTIILNVVTTLLYYKKS